MVIISRCWDIVEVEFLLPQRRLVQARDSIVAD
jgi:hypothetical protein